MIIPPLQIREFNREEDYNLVSDWWKSHDVSVPPLEMLPKLGIVVYEKDSPLAALWLYLDNSTGVCFLEKAVTAPKLKMSAARDALMLGVAFLKGAAARMDYGVMFLRTYPAMARFAKKLGFVSEGKPVECLFTLTQEVSDA